MATLPATHGAGCVLPVVHACPAQHGSHSLALRTSVRLVHRPDGHGSAAADAFAQNEPASHGTHTVAPAAGCTVPASQASHVPWAPFGCTVPGAHGVGVAAPVEHDEPAGQAMQSAADVMKGLVWFWYRPLGHGSAALAPSSQYAPTSHATHAVRPASFWYVPASHFSHVPFPVSLCTVPALHGSGCCAPVVQKCANGQAWHSLAAANPLSLPNRPASHESAALLPKGQYTPSPHASHAVAPAEPCSVPAAHGAQLLKPLALATLPAAHGVGCVAPVPQLCPGQHASHSSALRASVRLVHRPDGHGSAAADALAQYEPASQGSHIVCPASACTFPAKHASHVPIVLSGCTVPGAHGLGCGAPVLHDEPAGQAMQSSALAMNGLVWFW